MKNEVKVKLLNKKRPRKKLHQLLMLSIENSRKKSLVRSSFCKSGNRRSSLNDENRVKDVKEEGANNKDEQKVQVHQKTASAAVSKNKKFKWKMLKRKKAYFFLIMKAMMMRNNMNKKLPQ